VGARATGGPKRASPALAQVLAAITDGRLAVNEALEALAGAPGFDDRMRRLAARAARREARRVEVRRAPARAALLLAAQRRLSAAVPDGVHVGRGRHYRAGLPTAEFGLVAYVPAKLAADQLRADQRVGEVMAGRRGGRPYRLRVDVKPIPAAHKHAAIRPGNHSTVGTSSAHGMLSGVVQVGDQYAALLSGHVAGAPGTQIFARAIHGPRITLGVAGVVRDDATMDAAVVIGVDPNEVGWLSLAAAELRDVSDIHAAIAVTVACSDGVVRKTFVDDVGTPAGFAHGSMTGLLGLRPCVTVEGDSGAAVRDGAGKIVGFVVGGSASSTFALPARKVLRAMLDL
jgi:hypothetical protein